MSDHLQPPHDPLRSVSVLLVIENSGRLFSIWPDLRDRYLGPLLHKIELDNPSVPMTTFVLESLPPSPSQNRKPGVPRQYRTYHDGLQNVRFNHSPSNRLTYSKMKDAAKVIASTKSPGGREARHLVIVAAAPPVADLNDEPHQSGSLWHGLAEYLTKADVRCHLMFKSGQDCKELTNLFEEMLRLHKIPEEQPWFAIDMEKVTVRLSSLADRAKIGERKSESAILPPSGPAPVPLVGASLDLYSVSSPVTTISTSPNSPTATPPQSPQEPLPSLVSQLQQVHGLTKKKVYGSKPARKPFVSGELYRGDRKSLSMSPDSSTSATPSTHGGKVPSPSSMERTLRRSQASPSESRPHPKSRGSYDTATTTFTSPHTYGHSSDRYKPLSSGSVSLPPSPAPYPLTSRAPPDFVQPDLPWNASPPTGAPFAPNPHDRPLDYRQLADHPSHHAPVAYPHEPPSSVDDTYVPPTVPPLPHYTDDGSVTIQPATQYQYPPHAAEYASSPTSAYNENEPSNKSSAAIPALDPSVYRNELLSHLSGPSTTHYVPSTTYGSGLPGPYMKPRNPYLMTDEQTNETSHGSVPQVSDVWQSSEHLNGQYVSGQVATDGNRHKTRTSTPPGSSSLTNWAG